MSVFSGFGSWINQNIQQPPKAESRRFENVESNSEPPLEFKYYDRDEADRQAQLWIDEDKKHPWVDAPPKVKVTTKNGLCHMHIEMTIGRIPESVYLLFANPLNNQYFQDFDGHNFLETKSRKLLRKDGPRRIAEVEKVVSWNFLFLSGALPINLIVEDNQKDLSVTKDKDLCHLNMQFTIGLPPEAVFDILTTYENPSYFTMMKKRQTLEHRSSKVFSDLGPTEKHVNVEKAAPWRFLWWSGTIPVHLTFNESRKDFSALYMIPKKNVMFMKTFFGKWQVEPWYVDNSRYCKPRLPKNREEYRQCTGGKGLIASRVTLDQSFKPSSYLNLPPLSWYIRRVTIKTTKALVEDLQIRAAVIRSA